MGSDTLYHHVERDLVVSANRDDNIRIPLARFNIKLMHGFYGGKILVYDAVEASASFFFSDCQKTMLPSYEIE